MKIKIYIKGGGDSHLQDTEFRAAWAAFFENAGLAVLRKMPATFRGSGRTKTFDAYQTAVKTRKPDELPLLLVDSEDLVSSGTEPGSTSRRGMVGKNLRESETRMFS